MNLNRLTYRDGLLGNASLIPVAMMLAQNPQLIDRDPFNPFGLGYLGLDEDEGIPVTVVGGADPDEDTEDPGRLVPPHGSGP